MARLMICISALSLLCVSCSQPEVGKLENVEVVSFSLVTHQVRVVTKERDGVASLSTLADKLDDNFVVAMNGGIFDTNLKPLGLLVDGGRKLRPLNTSDGEGNFFLEPNGVFWIKGSEANVVSTQQYKPIEPDFAIQSGPLLLLDGEVHSKFNSTSKHRYTRNGIGVSKDGRVTVAYFGTPCTLYEMAVYFRDQLGCDSALYLDGAISGIMTRNKLIRPHQTFASILVVEKY